MLVILPWYGYVLNWLLSFPFMFFSRCLQAIPTKTNATTRTSRSRRGISELRTISSFRCGCTPVPRAHALASRLLLLPVEYYCCCSGRRHSQKHSPKVEHCRNISSTLELVPLVYSGGSMRLSSCFFCTAFSPTPGTSFYRPRAFSPRLPGETENKRDPTHKVVCCVSFNVNHPKKRNAERRRTPGGEH